MVCKVGTAAILLVALLSYIIWRFNPAFAFSKKNYVPGGETLPKNEEAYAKGEDPENELTSLEVNTLDSVTAKLFIQSEDNTPKFDMQLTEKEPAAEKKDVITPRSPEVTEPPKTRSNPKPV